MPAALRNSSIRRAGIARWLAAVVAVNAAWEIAQLPFYTVWRTGSPGEMLRAVVHCTLGDAGIALASLLLAVAVVGGRRWPSDAVRFRRVVVATMLFAVAYTVFSEWMNISVRGSWVYSEWMPTVPPLGTGLLPLLQWIATPAVGFRIIRVRPSPS